MFKSKKTAEFKLPTKSVSFSNKIHTFEFLSDSQRIKYESIIKSKLKKIDSQRVIDKKIVLYVELFTYLANEGYRYIVECKPLQDQLRTKLLELADDCPYLFGLFDEKTEKFVCELGGLLIVEDF